MTKLETGHAATQEKQSDDGQVLAEIVGMLNGLSPEGIARVLRAVASFYNLETFGTTKESAPPRVNSNAAGGRSRIAFSADLNLSPKEFMTQKQPRTDVERIACLAYYLANYRDTPHFKTLDLSKLNTEAAQPKFANATWASNNALKRGYLANATKGTRQLSAGGEQFVNALPDRDAARKAMERLRPRRRNRKSAKEA